MMKVFELSICPRCGNSFHCSKSGKCWCYEVYLPLNVLEEIESKYDSCLCPSCLKELSKPARNPDGKIKLENLIKLPYKEKKA
jgi:hypothetical protein